MKKHLVLLSCLAVSLAAIMILVSCSSDNSGNPAAPAGSAADPGNYAHMNGGSTLVGDHTAFL